MNWITRMIAPRRAKRVLLEGSLIAWLERSRIAAETRAHYVR